MSSSLFGTLADLWQALSGSATPTGDTSAAESAGAFSHLPCPPVNVDGTPMQDNTFDVMGRAYGDTGSSFSSGSFISGVDLYGSDS